MKITQVAICPSEASHAAGRPALTPELLAASGARYSRNNEGLQSILSKIDPDNLTTLYLIYTLSDPATQQVRYVGITRQSLNKRLKGHKASALKGGRLHCPRWIKSLLEKEMMPIIQLVEATPDPRREIFWIDHYRRSGCALTNLSDGGEGLVGFAHTSQAKRRIAEAGRTRYKNLAGREIGRLTVVGLAGHKPVKWECRCCCGKVKVVPAQSLLTARVKSCGCLSREMAAHRTRSRARHGMWKSKEYLTWIEMRARCGNPNHARYNCNGALGVQVCDRWQTSFENFLSDMGPKPERAVLLRKNKNADYAPGNCCWGTVSEKQKQSKEKP